MSPAQSTISDLISLDTNHLITYIYVTSYARTFLDYELVDDEFYQSMVTMFNDNYHNLKDNPDRTRRLKKLLDENSLLSHLPKGEYEIQVANIAQTFVKTSIEMAAK